MDVASHSPYQPSAEPDQAQQGADGASDLPKFLASEDFSAFALACLGKAARAAQARQAQARHKGRPDV